MPFILCGAAGFRIGEALGIEIDKAHFVRFSDDQGQAEDASLQGGRTSENGCRLARR
jgi:hypothetical protein